jgi:predicted MPP superfamily phosphohydrolase
MGETWARMLPGLWKKTGPGVHVGPWFQYHDAAGFEWNTYKVAIANLPNELEGLRIVQLSDLHCQTHWQTAYDALSDRLKADPPDLIVITGDIVDYIRRPGVCIPIARRLLNLLDAPLGVIGIFGNHDSGVDPDEFDDTPLQKIEGQRILLNQHGRQIELIAPTGPEREDYTPGFEKTLPEKTVGIPRIILSHYPDHIRKLKIANADLFLSGHTHGGQACLPGRIPLLKHDSLPHRMWHGVHRYENSWLFVNRGFGFSTLPIRVFCPAEVIEIRLTAAD